MIFLAKSIQNDYVIDMYKHLIFCIKRNQPFIGAFLKSDRGVTAIEYGLIALLIAVPIIGLLVGIGGHLLTFFTNVNHGFTNTP